MSRWTISPRARIGAAAARCGTRLRRCRRWLRHAHAALPRCWMEPLQARVLWSAAPSSLSTGLIDGAGAGAAAWDVALIDRTLPDQAILRRALEPGGHVILYDGRHDSAADVLLRAARWAESSGATI